MSLFPMSRKYHKRSSGSRDKYSVEHTLIRSPNSAEWGDVPATPSTVASKQWYIPIIPPTDLQGMRKVKHLTVSFSNVSEGEQLPIVYALVYVPQGYSAQPIRMPPLGGAISMYEANQFIMSTGVLDFSGGPLRIRTRLSRNLNSGDQIVLLLSTANSGIASYYTVEVTYAITLQ